MRVNLVASPVEDWCAICMYEVGSEKYEESIHNGASTNERILAPKKCLSGTSSLHLKCEFHVLIFFSHRAMLILKGFLFVCMCVCL